MRNDTRKKQNQQEEPSVFQELFSFTTKEGKLKSMRLLYGMVLAFVVLFVYFFAGHFITIWFEGLFSGMSRGLLNLLDVAIPTLLCTAGFCGLYFAFRDRTLLPLAFSMALVMVLFVAGYMLLAYEREVREIILPVVAYLFLVPSAIGTGCIYLTAYLADGKKKRHK